MDLTKLINNNINIALVCDERRFNGIKIDFLGHKAYCNTVPALLARRTGAKIYTIRANRERNLIIPLLLIRLTWKKQG